MRSETIQSLRSRLRSVPVAESELERLGRDPRAGIRALVRQERRRRGRHAVELERLSALLEPERACWARGLERVAGIDEAGAGPLAGPVVAAAVILPPETKIFGVDDSKRLSRKRREQLAETIRRQAVAWAVGSCSNEEIDQINILQAARLAMCRAVLALDSSPQHLLVDAREVPGVAMDQTALVRGDQRSQAIAAASILAKVHRDRWMANRAQVYPGYGFERHFGYGTAAHLAALRCLGPCPIHRFSFAPVAGWVQRA